VVRGLGWEDGKVWAWPCPCSHWGQAGQIQMSFLTLYFFGGAGVLTQGFPLARQCSST
jgi:hypothetical protein